MKTILCALAIAAAAVVAVALTSRRGGRPPSRTLMVSNIVAIVMAIAIPSVVFVVFALMRASRPFIYCVFLHNRLPYEHVWRVLWFVPMYPLIRTGALRIARSAAPVEVLRRRLFVFVAASCFLLALVAFWPLIAAESYLPFYPIAVVLAAPIIFGKGRPFAVAAVVMSCLGLIATGKPWRNDARHEITLVQEVLDLTRPSDPVMDLKGEAVFRRRPYWLVLEAITNCKYRLGIIPDRIAETLVKTHTAVVASRRFPPRSRRFVERNYVRWGALWVAGSPVEFEPDSPDQTVKIGIPARYIVITSGGVADAAIDGVSIGSGIDLNAGVHTVVIHDNAERAVVIWSGVARSSHFRAGLADAVERVNGAARSQLALATRGRRR